jgi:hypothetical protein
MVLSHIKYFVYETMMQTFSRDNSQSICLVTLNCVKLDPCSTRKLGGQLVALVIFPVQAIFQ